MVFCTWIFPLNMAIFHTYVNVYQRVVDEITPRLSCEAVCQALAKTNIKQAEEQRISYHVATSGILLRMTLDNYLL